MPLSRAQGSRARALLAVLVLLLAACGTSGASQSVQPREGRAGLHLAGSMDGRQLAVSDGAPQLVPADCDPGDGMDADLCFISRTIDGTLAVIVFENPDVLEQGAVLEVAGSPCRAQACDEVGDHAVVDVQIGTGARTRAVGGVVEIDVLEPSRRYTGTLRLRLPDGRINGGFDVVPRRD